MDSWAEAELIASSPDDEESTEERVGGGGGKIGKFMKQKSPKSRGMITTQQSPNIVFRVPLHRPFLFFSPLRQNRLIDECVFDVQPRESLLLPGESTTVTLTYRPNDTGVHTLPVVCEVGDGVIIYNNPPILY